MPPPKRRRVSSDELLRTSPGKNSASVVAVVDVDAADPNLITSSAATDDAADLPGTELDEIPQLLMVEMQKDNAADVVRALIELAILMQGDPDTEASMKDLIAVQYRQEANSLGAHIAVLLVMKKWQNNEDIQACGCYCIERLALDFKGEIAISKSGGMEAVVTAITLFRDSEEVLIAGISALSNVLASFVNEESVMRSATRFVTDLEGVSLVVRGMKAFPTNSKLQELSCEFLYDLCSEEKFRDVMENAGVIGAVALTIENNPSKRDNTKMVASRLMKTLLP